MTGRLEVVCGAMYSGKTEELIRRMRRAQYARQQVMIFKPSIDIRYSDSEVASHNQTRLPCVSVQKAADIWDYLLDENLEVIGIDEVQFLGLEAVPTIERLIKRGYRVIVSGLDTDWKGQPFEPVPSLMALADTVTKLTSICVVCGKEATRTQKIAEGKAGDQQIEVGAIEMYEARCRAHFLPAVQPPTPIFHRTEISLSPVHHV